MYEDEFELTFQVPEEESAPEPLAAPAAKPAAPMEPVADEPTRIMTLGKTAAPAVDEPTRVITLEKPAEPPAPPQPEEPAPEPVKERSAPAAPAAARRVLIKSAIELHRYKGTPWAIKQALTKLGLERFSLVEHPEDAHWAEFDVDITVVNRPLTEAIYPQITQLIDTYKPARSHLRRLIVSVASRGAFNAACVAFAGDIVTVQPYQLTDITAPSMQPKAGIGRHDWGTTTIYPRTL